MIQHVGRMDLRMFPPELVENHMEEWVISRAAEEDVTCRPQPREFALDFGFHGASPRARDAMPS
jgi:hypothetical protein